MKLKTVDELRRLRAEKSPLFSVEYLPYIEFFEKYPERKTRFGHGRLDDIYTTLPEAKRRFASLRREGFVEEMNLYQTTYDSGGGRGQRLIDEWKDRRLARVADAPTAKEKPLGGNRRLVRLQSELRYAREEYKFLARQEHRLSRDEYAQKMQAERRVAELESAITKINGRGKK